VVLWIDAPPHSLHASIYIKFAYILQQPRLHAAVAFLSSEQYGKHAIVNDKTELQYFLKFNFLMKYTCIGLAVAEL
jgi:hypothetical protein